ncbi:MAG: Crp/Fnr family transcriptional regulator [Vallitaleaceae bacterium]|jgi:CRP-like cAMP-binding protein|nr:Crp/Fnr family transcriptional regulator [Vallitaleaceae bacterium]
MKISEYSAALQNNPLCKDMNAEELDYVLKCLKPKVRHYLTNDIIAVGDTEFTGVGVIISGEVLITKELVTGYRHIMAKLGPKNLFGEMIAFSDKKVWPATVTALTDTTVLFLPPNMIIGTCSKMCQGHTKLIINMLAIVSNKALRLNRKVEYLTIKGMREKLVTYLLEAYKKSATNVIQINLSRSELAEFLNVSRPSMSRELARMKDEGLIDYHKSSFRIIDLDRLTSIIF